MFRTPAPRLCAVRALPALFLLATSAAAASDPAANQLVFDVAPFTPFSAVGELIGVGTAEGEVVHARLDATFVVTETVPWSMSVSFVDFPMGGAIGFSSTALGWSGTGTFTTSVESASLNGPLAIPDGSAFYSWFMTWAGGASSTLPGGGVSIGPMDGVFTELKLTLTLAACPNGDVDLPWEDEGNALAGSFGEPVLSGSGSLCTSELATLRLENALPGGITNLVLGLSSIESPLLGGVLVPSPDTVLFGLPIDSAGVSELTFTWPPSVPSGFTFWAQHWFADPGAGSGFAASNGLRACAP